MKSQLVKNFGNRDQAEAVQQQNEMQKRLQEVQIKMQKKADEIENMEFKASSSENGKEIIEVLVKGDKSLLEVKILDESAFPKDDLSKLCDLVVSTANKALCEVDRITDEEIANITKGLPISGLN